MLYEKNSKKSNGIHTETNGILKDIENEISSDMNDRSIGESEKDFINRKTSYYVEENEKILNLLITNCEPILTEIVS